MVSDLNIFVWKWFKIAGQKTIVFRLILSYKSWWKPRFPMDQRPLVEGHIANVGIPLDVFEFLQFIWFFPFFKNFGFLGILGPPYCGIRATIPIGREMLCLPYAGFLIIPFQVNVMKSGVCKLNYFYKVLLGVSSGWNRKLSQAEIVDGQKEYCQWLKVPRWHGGSNVVVLSLLQRNCVPLVGGI